MLCREHWACFVGYTGYVLWGTKGMLCREHRGYGMFFFELQGMFLMGAKGLFCLERRACTSLVL
jgi:hypothetical protein